MNANEASVILGVHFYFVHSYVAVPNNPADILGETDYGTAFASIIARDNLVATQFHPEKTASIGIQSDRSLPRSVADSAHRGGRAEVTYDR